MSWRSRWSRERSRHLVVGAILLAACQPPTQIELVVTTDVPCAEFAGVGIGIDRPEVVEGAAPRR